MGRFFGSSVGKVKAMNVTVVVPTYNGGKLWEESAKAISDQRVTIDRVKVVDSSSKDNTREIARKYGFDVTVIEQKDFDHGGTRSYALEGIDSDVVVFLTQDAILADEDAIKNLVEVFEEHKNVACAYGRQLPHDDADLLAAHARNKNYSSSSYICDINSDYPRGLKKAYMSNSFAAYRVDRLKSIGGFPSKLILAEDFYVAAKFLENGDSVAYIASAKCKHSHNYTVTQEFKRYFDIGVCHSTQNWMLKLLGRVEGEGVLFAKDQFWTCLKSKKYFTAVRSILCSFAKFLGYKMGLKYEIFPMKFVRSFSMYKSYWNK